MFPGRVPQPQVCRQMVLATRLLQHAFATFHRRGATAVDLKIINPAAISLYRSVGIFELNRLSALSAAAEVQLSALSGRSCPPGRTTRNGLSGVMGWTPPDGIDVP